jgi:tetraacyldisaccharide 4'-kinase
LGADYLICTEKDKVKLSSKSVSSLPILYTEAELKVVEGLTEWESFISQVKSKILCS